MPAAQVLVALLEALRAAHEAGVVHRDVKPGNVMLEPDGRVRVRVLDFGLAQLADQDSLTHSGELVGTAGYMAPKVVRSSAAASSLSDVYSAGVVPTRQRPPKNAAQGSRAAGSCASMS